MPESNRPNRQPDRSAELAELLSRRILLLDGATGTMRQISAVNASRTTRT